MKLFLASEAKHPDSVEKLKKFVGKDLSKLTISYIPTAANGEMYGCWKGGGSINVASSLGAKLKVTELEDRSYKNVISEIKGADILWMAGGMTGYLLYWIRRVELDKALPEILDSGTIYVGSSAGSMACSKTQNLLEWYVGETEPGASVLPGLGFIDFEIYPHFEDGVLPEIKKRWKKGKLYMIKNGEVITLDNNEVNVLGEERVLEK